MGIDTLLNSDESRMVADIIVSFSLVDEALCTFLKECPLKDKDLEEAVGKINKDSSNVGMADKIDLVVKIFPNNSTPSFNNLKGDLMKMKKIRNTVAHHGRFFFGEKHYSIDCMLCKKYQKGDEPITVLYKEYSRLFDNISELLTIIYSDWEYKQSFLYGMKIN